jgi:hypothetical protein
MFIERNYEGAWVVSDIVRGCRVVRRYYGYTRREALAMFNNELAIMKVEALANA